MENNSDKYKTIDKPSEEAIFKDRGSKFIAYAFPVSSENDVNLYLQSLKEKHHKARHWCYAWRIGIEDPKYRANDDGEPNNSAGQPIYGQLLSFDLTNILVVVVRYFGGTKLGVGGLINAYKTAANLTLQDAKIEQKTINVLFDLNFDYKDMNKVMRLVKGKNIKIEKQAMNLDCNFTISVRKNDADQIKRAFKELRCVKITEV